MSAIRRAFIILGHTAPVTPDFTLNDLPGSAGRLDILCRCVTAAFCLSHAIRTDVHVYLVLRDQVTLHFEGARLKHLNPDERSTGALIKRALEALPNVRPTEQCESTPGVFVSLGGLPRVLDKLQAEGIALYLLHEHGKDLRTVEIEEPVAFVLSDHREFHSCEEALLAGYPRLSLGPMVLHADHCVAIVHNELDRRASPPLK